MHGSSVTASSLADIQSIADSPPDRPSLRRGRGQPLTLYIARVPGSKDIFLTTLKPKEKVVSAFDVESSLYYLHLESDHDELLREDLENSDTDSPGGALTSEVAPPSPPGDGRLSDEHPPPVPAHAVNPSSTTSFPPALPLRPQEAPALPKRKPVNSSNNNNTTTNGSALAGYFLASTQPPPVLPPRPLGPRPRGGAQHDDNWSGAAPSNQHDRPLSGSYPRTPPQLPRRPVPVRGQDTQQDVHLGHYSSPQPDRNGFDDWSPRPQPVYPGTSRSPHSYDASWNRPPSGPRPPLSPRPTTTLTRTRSVNSAVESVTSPDPTRQSFNVIMIRRDPASGVQSNVGKITMPPTSANSGRPGKALLQIFNPGYEKFRSARGITTADLVRCISEDDHCTYSGDLRLATRRRSIKSPSGPYFGDAPVNQLIAVTPSQPYSFVSPWNRVCEFSTGVSGRSLKCRHMLARGTLGDADSVDDMDVVTLSELRFNTPATSVFSKVGSPRRRPVRHNHSSSTASASVSLPQLPPRPRRASLSQGQSQGQVQNSGIAARPSNESSGRSTFDGLLGGDGGGGGSYQNSGFENDEDWDIEPMDLSLGQEKPGGGFKGNKAKLGKLIIEPEGLEMLDLLVAANMGVWWSIR